MHKCKTLATLISEENTDEGVETSTESISDETATEDSQNEETAVETVTEAPATNAVEGVVTNQAVLPKMVSISADELSTLRKDAKSWNDNQGKFKVLTDWHSSMVSAGASSTMDASDAEVYTKRVSKGNAIAKKAYEKSQKK
jgi:hypothetical protein